MKSRLNPGCVLAFTVVLVLFKCAGGGLMHMMMMKKMMKHHHDHHEEGKGISIAFKPISIPIPVPIAYVDKGSMKAEKPWPQESKGAGMMMKMMKMKMKMKMMMMKKMKKMMKGKKKACCPSMQQMPQMKMKAGWPPMIMPMTMCPQTMMMMNGMCDMAMSGCMMNGGWPMKMMNANRCPEPEEEEEEELEVEDWPEYYEEEMMEDQNAWDTNPVPVYRTFDDKRTPGKGKRGDDFEDPGSMTKNRIVWLKVKDASNRIRDRPQNSFEYDFEYF